MEIQTKVFKDVLRRHKRRIAKAAVKAVVETMQETYRFGSFDVQYIEDCAVKRLSKHYQESKGGA